MSYFLDPFSKVNIQQIASFIMYGDEFTIPTKGSYEQRIEEAWNSFVKEAKKLYPDLKETDRIFDFIIFYASVVEEIYMEVGMRCRSRAGSKLLKKRFNIILQSHIRIITQHGK